MQTVKGRAVLSAFRQGSSWPVLVDVGGSKLVTKLRGTAQGTAPLVAEVVAGELADALGLSTPARSLVELTAGVPSADPHEELLDLLARSAGVNLGFQFLEGFRDLKPPDARRIRPEIAAPIIWLDALLENPDRTERNPNLMIKAGQVWLIDHGAALTFQYDWANVTEQTPRQPGPYVEGHLLQVTTRELLECDFDLGKRVQRDLLEHALEQVPDAFLSPLAPVGADLDRVRAAYVAYLWKRLRAPRPFVAAGQSLPFRF